MGYTSDFFKYLDDEKKPFTSLKYEVLKDMKVGEAVIKEAVNHWERFGFLNDIKDERKKEQVSVAFDNIAYDILKNNERILKLKEKYDFLDFEMMVFPLIRRIICGNKFCGCLYTDKFTYDKFLDLLEKYTFLTVRQSELFNNKKYDMEAEFICILANIIAEIFNLE
jgi:hypothetical protein